MRKRGAQASSGERKSAREMHGRMHTVKLSVGWSDEHFFFYFTFASLIGSTHNTESEKACFFSKETIIF